MQRFILTMQLKPYAVAFLALCLFLRVPATFADDSLVTFTAPVSAPHQDAHINYALSPLKEKYYVWVPPDFSRAQVYGLIVYTSPLDQCGIPAGWAEVLTRHKFLFVAAQNAGNNVNLSRRCGLGVLGALEMMHSYRIDPSRIYAAGLSGGARTASALAFWQPDIFRGTIQDCGSNFYRAVARRAAPRPQNELDATYGVLDSTSAQDATTAKGAVKFVLITGPGDFRHGYLLDIYNNGFLADGFRAKLIDVDSMGHEECSGSVLEQALNYLK